MTKDCCQNCRYWFLWRNQPNAGPSKGECRFTAPEAFQNLQSGAVNAKFPSTTATTWCGEHERDDARKMAD